MSIRKLERTLHLLSTRSGIVDTAAAVSTDLYVTGENNYPVYRLEMLRMNLHLM